MVFINGCAVIPTPTSSNPAIVTFDISSNGASTLTFWRKLNPDGSKGKVFSIGGGGLFNLIINESSLKTIRLDAGTYYMDSFQISIGSEIILSEFKHYTLRNSLNDNGEPKYLSFTVNEGEDMILPSINIIVKNYGIKNQQIYFNFKDKNNISKLGNLVKNNY